MMVKIIRSRFYACLKEQMQKGGKKNYMTVPAAIRELEKIEMIRQSDHGLCSYRYAERNPEGI